MRVSFFIALTLASVPASAWGLRLGHQFMSMDFCISNITEAENEVETDGDELFYIDFDRKVAVQRLPDFSVWDIDPGVITMALQNRDVCRQNVEGFAKCEKYPPEEHDPPTAVLYPENQVTLGKPNTLICYVTDFHPPVITVRWTKNELPVHQGISQTQFYPNRDYTYRVFSYLNTTLEAGDVYSCSVEHQTLDKPLTRIWEPEVQAEAGVGATAFCGAGLMLGLLGVVTGTFFLIKSKNCN
ncbi:H-2 class II histocompatibility antigen, A-Q alpha chain [Amia ocellicauda]|uniref:H-2 class II histocompatibility antigen, A-Q alpha chain n=1 Tax=Amia ocellicauda TaxID=2972642 RepID=UPI003464585F